MNDVLPLLWFCLSTALPANCNPDARRLYDDLMHKRDYNKHIIPVMNASERLTVHLALRLSQLLDLVHVHDVTFTITAT